MAQVGMQDVAADVLRERFGFEQFRPGQREMVDAILSGRDALGIMPTGAGKSVCYQVPAATEKRPTGCAYMDSFTVYAP